MLSFEELWAVEALPAKEGRSRKNVVPYGNKGRLVLHDTEKGPVVGVSGILKCLGLKRGVKDAFEGHPIKMFRLRGEAVAGAKSPFVVDARGAINILSLLRKVEGAEEFTTFFRSEVFGRLAQ